MFPTLRQPRVGLGLAAIGRPAYITVERDSDLGQSASRSVDHLRARAQELLEIAWQAGVRYFDAARSYGLAEEFLGSWLSQHPERRAELTIASKWGYEYVGNWQLDAKTHERKEHSPAMFDRQWEQSQQTLGTTPDIYYVHSITPDSPALDDAELLNRLRVVAGQGVRIGLTTSGPSQPTVLHRALTLPDTPFSAVQATWNLLEQSVGGQLHLAHASGWLVVIKEALANGRLAVAGSYAWLDAAALALGRPVAQLAFGVALAVPDADVVLSGAVTARQLTENVATPAMELPAQQVSSYALAPAQYWRERSALRWS